MKDVLEMKRLCVNVHMVHSVRFYDKMFKDIYEFVDQEWKVSDF